MLSLSSPSIFSELIAPGLTFLKHVRLTFKVSRIKENRGSLEYIQKNVAKKQTLVCIGIKQDEHLFLLRKVAGRFGKLVVFTPGADLFTHLQQLVEKIRWTNVSVEPLVFSEDTNGVFFNSFSVNGTQLKRATVIERIDSQLYKRKELFASPTLDSFCVIENIRPDFLEIKMPGFELQILRGATGLMKKFRPTIIIECEERLTGRSHILEVFKYLKELNYKGFFILDTIRIPLQNFDFDIYQNPRTNFFCSTFIFE